MLPTRHLRRFLTSRPSADCRSRRPTLAALGLLAALTFGEGATAQDPLVYSNGPFLTVPWSPGDYGAKSVMQVHPPIQHSYLGYEASWPYRLTDQFTVNSVLQIREIEVFAFHYDAVPYPVPSCLGVFLSIWNGNPASGSPAQLIQGAGNSVNLVGAPGFIVANALTNIFRMDDYFPDWNRNVQSIRVTLPWPVTIGPGTYYLEYSLMGASGLLYTPPLTTPNVGTTGDARQRVPGSGYMDLWSGPHAFSQGLPFNFYSSCCPPFTLPGAITNLGGGCSGASLSVAGAAAVGGHVRAELSNVNPLTFGVIVLGITDPNIPLLACSCTSHASPDMLLLGTDYELQVPTVGSLAGAELFFQGAQFNLSGTSGTTACNLGLQFDLTDGYSYRLNVN
ncbi:MAG: hypothetical protein JNN13_03690 [Planctomycetes bacterium]|nr:hypothetical protein [Planctomycetota bacterium]